jgi:hypothetical protein
MLLKQSFAKTLGKKIGNVVLRPNPFQVHGTISEQVLNKMISKRYMPIAIGSHLGSIHLNAGLIVNLNRGRSSLFKTKLSEKGTLIDNTLATLGACNQFSFHRTESHD